MPIRSVSVDAPCSRQHQLPDWVTQGTWVLLQQESGFVRFMHFDICQEWRGRKAVLPAFERFHCFCQPIVPQWGFSGYVRQFHHSSTMRRSDQAATPRALPTPVVHCISCPHPATGSAHLRTAGSNDRHSKRGRPQLHATPTTIPRTTDHPDLTMISPVGRARSPRLPRKGKTWSGTGRSSGSRRWG